MAKAPHLGSQNLTSFFSFIYWDEYLYTRPLNSVITQKVLSLLFFQGVHVD